MASMVSAEEQDALGNFAYICAIGETIWLVHRTLPGADFKPFFDDLLVYMANKPTPDIPLPLLDLVNLGCEFLPNMELIEKLTELPAE